MTEEQPEDQQPSTELAKVSAGLNIDLGLGDLIQQVVGAPLEQATGLLRDVLGMARLELSLLLLKRAQRKVEAAGFDQQTLGPVDLSRLLPILEFGSIATDESLQDRWASLLANALLDPDGVPPSYPEILRQLTPAEVAILDRIYEEAGSTWPTSAYEPQLMAERAGFSDAGERVILSTQNLLRLYLVKSKALVFPGATQEDSKVHLTHLGHAFVSACRPPIAPE